MVKIKKVDMSDKDIDWFSGVFMQSCKRTVCNTCKGNDHQCTDCSGAGINWDLDTTSRSEFVSKYGPYPEPECELHRVQDLGTDTLCKIYDLRTRFDPENPPPEEWFRERFASKFDQEFGEGSWKKNIPVFVYELETFQEGDVVHLMSQLGKKENIFNCVVHKAIYLGSEKECKNWLEVAGYWFMQGTNEVFVDGEKFLIVRK
jgi:hypothetical protein